MIQDILPKKLINTYDVRVPAKDDRIVFVNGNMLLCRLTDGKLSVPSYEETAPCECRYILRVDDICFFCSWDRQAAERLEDMGYEYRKLPELRECGPKWLRFGTLTAFSYASWYEKNRYCGRCGALMKHSSTERAVICPECSNLIYPRICPVVIVGVIKDDTILLTKYKAKMNINRYALIAGFAEIGESIEQTVSREVMEETGVRVKNLHFYKSQPWAFSDSLLMGFYCEADGDETAVPDGTELGFADWMTRDQVPALQDEVSLTAEMMDRFKKIGRGVLEF